MVEENGLPASHQILVGQSTDHTICLNPRDKTPTTPIPRDYSPDEMRSLVIQIGDSPFEYDYDVKTKQHWFNQKSYKKPFYSETLTRIEHAQLAQKIERGQNPQLEEIDTLLKLESLRTKVHVKLPYDQKIPFLKLLLGEKNIDNRVGVNFKMFDDTVEEATAKYRDSRVASFVIYCDGATPQDADMNARDIAYLIYDHYLPQLTLKESPSEDILPRFSRPFHTIRGKPSPFDYRVSLVQGNEDTKRLLLGKSVINHKTDKFEYTGPAITHAIYQEPYRNGVTQETLQRIWPERTE